MGRDLLINLGLVAWFFLLAIAELTTFRAARATDWGDARLLTNFGLMAMILFVGSLFPLTGLTAAAISKGLGLGVGHEVAMPWLAMLALTLLSLTFAAYWVHRLMHRVPLLWRIHRVHHADNAVDVSTSLRNHPFELLVTLPVSTLVILLVGPPASVVVVSQPIILAAAIWQHADIELPTWLDRMLAPLIITPRLHRLHHNPVRIVHDSNYGDLFSIWDRIFGTLTVMEGRGRVGLNDQRTKPDSLLQQIVSPLFPA